MFELVRTKMIDHLLELLKDRGALDIVERTAALDLVSKLEQATTNDDLLSIASLNMWWGEGSDEFLEFIMLEEK